MFSIKTVTFNSQTIHYIAPTNPHKHYFKPEAPFPPNLKPVLSKVEWIRNPQCHYEAEGRGNLTK
jgi:hypothetical protein